MKNLFKKHIKSYRSAVCSNAEEVIKKITPSLKKDFEDKYHLNHLPDEVKEIFWEVSGGNNIFFMDEKTLIKINKKYQHFAKLKDFTVHPHSIACHVNMNMKKDS